MLTATVPERDYLLEEAAKSVADQTVQPVVYHIGVDENRLGAAVTYNKLVEQVDTEWVTFLDDDDLLLPNHLEVLLANSEHQDIVYTRPRFDGWTGHPGYLKPYSPELLEKESIVPITAMLRTDLFREVGGFPDGWGYDWRMWLACSDVGARVNPVEEVTWVYRRGDWPSQSHGEMR